MRDKKFFSKITPLQIAITICCLVACAMTVMWWVAHNRTETITEAEAPLSAASMIMEGDKMTVRINAPQVDDLYGYQFRLEYDNTRFSVSDLTSLIDEIPMIFKKDFNGYILIGATMIGASPGYSASDIQICELNLTALTDDGKLPEINISKIRVVSSELESMDITGWIYEIVTNTHDE